MKVSEIMTPGCRYLGGDDTIEDAARLMADEDLGAVPIADGDRLIGMVTDRDIVTRGVATDGDMKKMKARDLMTNQVFCCYDDDDTGKVAAYMGELQVRRMPVVTRDKELVGMVSLGDLSVKGAQESAGDALANISRP